MLSLVTVAMLVIHLSSFVSAKSIGDNLRHNDVTSKDVNLDNQVTSLLTPLGAVPDRHHRAILDRIQRVIPERKRRAIPYRIRGAIPDTVKRVIPDRIHRAIPDRIRRVIPDRYRRATKPCTVDCSRVKHRPVCGTDRQTYRHKCELKRIRRCEGRRVRAVPMGFCTGIHGNSLVTVFGNFKINVFCDNF